MDPLWVWAAEMWWIAPVVVGAGTLGWVGVRHQRAESARRLEYDAARHELRAARSEALQARSSASLAKADLARLEADRIRPASSAELAAARRELQRRQQEARATATDVRARRAYVRAARSAVPVPGADPSALPLRRVIAEHDAITARWMAYETDPARLIAFPTMSDGRQPLTAAYLAEQSQALALRPSPTARVTPVQYAAYRDAVHRVARAFDAAEQSAWRAARAAGTVPPDTTPPADAAAPPHWTDLAQSVAQTALAATAEAIARATERAAGKRPPERP
ncbi:hypothetical protein ACFQRL_14525 [Microbacterium fluvii]|uniref:Uncharacterized protein n=1 Tax=Microbacterium fluvii TaxID=415215 RepID=A0ABW2HGE9_9MICO|nr:hypothetical protein [Microbacterium fluvii]MCU4673807.1 hypothetical protein [Microbacterium fluvii]